MHRVTATFLTLLLAVSLSACGGGGGGGSGNNAPVADAGVDQSVEEGSLVALDGSASSDGDGDELAYQWTAPAGVTLSSPVAMNPTFLAPDVSEDSTLTFTLEVNDGKGGIDTDSVAVTVLLVNQLPEAEAGSAQAVIEGATVQLEGSASDADGHDLLMVWSSPSHPDLAIDAADTARPSFEAPDVVTDTDIEIQLSVSDGHGGSATSSVTVTVRDSLQLVIDFPPPNSLTDMPAGSTLMVRGSVADDDPGSTVEVAGRPVTIDAEGYWSLDYSIVAGENDIAVVANDTEGNEITRNIRLLQVNDRSAVAFGAGALMGNPRGSAHDPLRERLLVGAGIAGGAYVVDFSTGDRTTIGSTGSGDAIWFDEARDRFLAFSGSTATASPVRIFALDPVYWVEKEFSQGDDGNGVGVGGTFDVAMGVDDPTYVYALSRKPEPARTAYLFRVNVDPDSTEYGMRELVDESPRSGNTGGVSVDDTSGNVIVGDCDLLAWPLDSTVPTAATLLLPRVTDDFCVGRIVARDGIAYALDWSPDPASNNQVRILEIDLTQATPSYSVASDLTDPTQGPLPTHIKNGRPSMDWMRGVMYLPDEGLSIGADTIIAIDVRTGARVVITQQP